MEEVRDPLRYVELIELVVLHAMLQKSIDKLADSGHRAFLGQIFQLVHRFLSVISFERVDQNVYKQIDNLDFS